MLTNEMFTSWETWTIVLIILGFGVPFTLLRRKNKRLKSLPKPLILIFLGALMFGAGFEAWEGTWLQETVNWDLLSFIAMAFTSLLMFQAGIEVDIKEFKRIGKASVLMGVLPAIIEGVLVGSLLLPLIIPFGNAAGFNGAQMLQDYWAFAYAMGFAIAAATPGIILPLATKYMNRGYSRHNKLNEIIIIGSSLDDILAILMFLIFVSMAVPGERSIGTVLAQTPFKIISSIIVGIVFGYVIYKITKPIIGGFSKKTSSTLVLVISMSFMVGMMELGYFVEHLSNHNHLSEGLTTANKVWGWFQFEFLFAAMVSGLIARMLLLKKVEKHTDKEYRVVHKFMETSNSLWSLVGSVAAFAIVGINFNFAVLADGKIYIFIPIILIGGIIGKYSGISLSLRSEKDKFKWNDKLIATIIYTPKGTATTSMILLVMLMGIEIDAINMMIDDMLIPLSILAIAISIPVAEWLVKWLHPKLQFKTQVNDPSPIVEFRDVFPKRKK